MAQGIWNESSVKLLFLNGMKENGEPNIVTKSFKDVKEAATPDQLMAVAEAIASIVSYPLYSVVRYDSIDINK
ncbi:MAG TPA: DUF1659 domain-containing protein [Niallia sp.]|nr:DUF1659 domain-containing protein [Niallia sp.]